MPLLAVKGRNNYSTLLEVRKASGVREAFLFGEYIHVFIEEGFDEDMLRKLPGVRDVKVVKPNIEDVFIKIMNHGAEV